MDWKLVGGIGLVGLGLLGLNRQSKRAESFEATQWWNRQSATGHEKSSGDYGGFYIPNESDKEIMKEIFKDWKPKAYPYEKRITQDSFNNWCEDCGKIHDEEKLIHYQFYLPQSNSRISRMRYVSGNYCSNDADCGADICESCYDNGNECEECSTIICNTCKEDSEYATGDVLCQECMPEEHQAESFSADSKRPRDNFWWLYRLDSTHGVVSADDWSWYEKGDEQGWGNKNKAMAGLKRASKKYPQHYFLLDKITPHYIDDNKENAWEDYEGDQMKNLVAFAINGVCYQWRGFYMG